MKWTSKALLVILLVLTACTGNGTTAPTGSPSGGTPTLPDPVVSLTSAPDAQQAARDYLDNWIAFKYEDMYAQLSRVSRDALPAETFVQRHTDTAQALTLQSLQVDILSVLTEPHTAQVAYRTVFTTALLGTLNRQSEMTLVLEDGAWKVQWDDGMLLPELKGGNRLKLDLSRPQRGDIYDNKGDMLVTQADAYAIGIQPGLIKSEDAMLSLVSDLTGRTPQSIKALYEYAAPDWYIPVGEASAQAVDEVYDRLVSAGGVLLSPFTARYYFDGGVAPQSVGYVLSISPEQLDEYRRKGYAGDEVIGAAGIEKTTEAELTGSPKADLYLVDPNGAVLSLIAGVDPKPSHWIYTTLDKNLQIQTQNAIQGFTGAAVVLEVSTGRVLAMASSPSFDPNLFTPSNANRGYLLDQVLGNSANVQLNRATQASYPLGSVFKIVTMAAALETGEFTPDSEYECGYEFTELPGVVLDDWTKEKEVPPSGLLTLSQGLMRSCNPWFYHIGLELFRRNHPQAVSNMARSFGLGSATGINAVAEDTGNIPDPGNEGDAVQLAIGQGAMLVTPLQVADFIAAIANGGTLYRPQIIDKITAPDGTPSFTFTPEVRGTLPISTETLQAIQEAMGLVTQDRRGTARQSFTGLGIPVYGKTGTATNPMGKPHAWFAAYTAANRENRPDIAVVVLCENAGDGSEFAAPITRRIIEVYFEGRPGRLYPWESTYNVTRTPKPDVTNTPEAGDVTPTP